jgi:hypothetical protein
MSDKSNFHMASTGAFTGRVGHKAGGFISKKFFHPSNFKNQEKLWQAIEAKKEQEKRQEELMKKREEEKRIEQLKSEMYGGSSSSDFKKALAANRPGLITHNVSNDAVLTSEQRQAASETRKRLEFVNKEPKAEFVNRLAVSSRYPEDILERGHSQIWGSYFDLKEQVWGYACCKCLQREIECPLTTKRIKQ